MYAYYHAAEGTQSQGGRAFRADGQDGRFRQIRRSQGSARGAYVHVCVYVCMYVCVYARRILFTTSSPACKCIYDMYMYDMYM